ncbi:ABC transporter substrate-binding protein [Ornithinibacillus sp. 4-3]|uniref:ABC transporter substrate-binding protein n=1 Tax=Ornithinibacillus sp. 4-3 TaxID=3231488 RepID=A0AB39HLT5_9BACI
MKKLVSLVLFIFLGFVLIACSSDSKGDAEQEGTEEPGAEEKGEAEKDTFQELKVAYSAQPHLLDPHVTTNIATSDVSRHFFESLLTVDSEYNVQPMLAESWELSEDGKTFTFQLRQGVTFHNGKELKAEDVVASLNRWSSLAGGKGLFEDAEFVEIDDYTLELRMPEPLSIALTGLSYLGGGFAAIMPKEVIENASPDGVTEFIGTGPYEFKEWKQDQYVLLTKYEDYVSREEEPDGLFGRREAIIDEIRFIFVADSSTRVAGIQSGEYDLAHAVPFDNADQLESNPDLVNYVYPTAYLIAHFNKKQGFFADKTARQAALAAIQAEDVLKAAYSSEKYYMLNHSLMMPHQQDQWYSDAGQELYNQDDQEKAKALLEEAGYDGEEIKIIATRDYEDQYLGGVVLQEQLQNIGMNVTLEVYDWPTLSDLIYEEDAYDIFMMGNIPSSEPSSSVMFRADYAGWPEDPKLEELIQKFRSMPTEEEAKPVFDELQEWFYDYVPSLRFGDFNRVATAHKSVGNFQYQDGFFFWNMTNSKE